MPLPTDRDPSDTINDTPAAHAVDHNFLAVFYNQSLGGGGAVATKTANYTATAADALLLADATSNAVQITLPAVSAGLVLIVKRIDAITANLVTIVPASGTIDGSASDALSAQWQARTYVSNGTGWFKI